MWIKQFKSQEHNVSGDWLVKGVIGIEGEFSREEWNRIHQTFIALGLTQVGKAPPSRSIPSRSEITEAIMARAGGNYEPMKLLKEKYPKLKELTA
jgi:hypothetical protein